jgi:hypothetical protein
MAIKVNGTVTLGPKTARVTFRVTEISSPRPIPGGTESHQFVTLVDVQDRTTWRVTVKENAARINWNVRRFRVMTEADHMREIREEQARVAQEFPYLTRVRVNGRLGVVQGASKWIDRLNVRYEDGGEGDPQISSVEKVD